MTAPTLPALEVEAILPLQAAIKDRHRVQAEPASVQNTGRRANAYIEPQHRPSADYRANARCRPGHGRRSAYRTHPDDGERRTQPGRAGDYPLFAQFGDGPGRTGRQWRW